MNDENIIFENQIKVQNKCQGILCKFGKYLQAIHKS